MPLSSFSDVRALILKCLADSASKTTEEAGWGVCKGNELSVVNTAEALLTYQELDALSDPFIQTHRNKIAAFLKNRVITELKKPNITTRYLSYGALGLHVLGDSELEAPCVERLEAASNPGGGWAAGERFDESLVVPTYHAMIALQNIGASIDKRHYEWLISMQRSDYLLQFSPSDPSSSFGASALALYLLVNSQIGGTTPVGKFG